ncbi:hypothetical protein L7F22_021305 [Adiantum nelumboides]|nr:hypothetical protein [Adiantum nelumboides]
MRWRAPRGRRFSVAWPPSARSCFTLSRPTGLLWPKGHPAGHSPASARAGPLLCAPRGPRGCQGPAHLARRRRWPGAEQQKRVPDAEGEAVCHGALQGPPGWPNSVGAAFQGQGQGQGRERVAETLERAREVAQQEAERAAEDDIQIDVLYISLNDPISLGSLEGATGDGGKRGAILSGAAMIKDGPDGRATRLIDNVLLGFAM